ncbi:hypothetical protein [Streptomyces beijiangensis]|uniref:Uncharacterized protein n=1 Tax=Streptomyces beijiangensis TaxID=163361 RepID=A0A939F9K5_9ACTN|nr:hypothetical protein [Streptomyces beijiangensis]MBO0514567.1 hypothetical protein [Streptomyces beijiangensis]
MLQTLLASAAALTALLPGPPASWPAPADVPARVRAAGLTMLDEEAMTMHIHPHLEVFVDGRPMTVPADIGIDRSGPKPRYSPLHTHDTSGVVHVESATWRDFTLGQLLTEWGAPRTDGRGYVNGRAHQGDPARIVLHDQDEIRLVYGRS